jgi:hypothetical protein
MEQSILAVSDSDQVKPEFIRLPKPGKLCPHTGLSRSKLNELILPCEANHFKPPVKSISLRKRGQVRGVRLIVFDSLISDSELATNERGCGTQLPNGRMRARETKGRESTLVLKSSHLGQIVLSNEEPCSLSTYLDQRLVGNPT